MRTRLSLEFPELTGRVVDQAGLLTAEATQQLTRLLEQHEQETGNQIVVVTLSSLQGDTIEDYGYQLGRHWDIGQAERNNGVLLFVSVAERHVEIVADQGINEVVAHDAWQSIVNGFIERVRMRQVAEGFLTAIAACGELLADHFPAADDNRNELPNRLVEL
jgi:uncharacterized protein